MKKTYCFYSILFIGLLYSAALVPADLSDKQIKQELTDIKTQTNQTSPATIKKMNSIEKVINFLDKQLYCLGFGGKCSPRTRTVANYALGFAWGYSAPIDTVPRLIKFALKKNIENKKAIAASQIMGEAVLSLAGLKGIVFTPYTSAIREVIITAIFAISDIKAAVDVSRQQESVFTFIKEMSKIVAANAKCIWSESYCQTHEKNFTQGVTNFTHEIASNAALVVSGLSESEITPAAVKRNALYFWLGYLSGVTAKKARLMDYLKKGAQHGKKIGGEVVERIGRGVEQGGQAIYSKAAPYLQ